MWKHNNSFLTSKSARKLLILTVPVRKARRVIIFKTWLSTVNGIIGYWTAWSEKPQIGRAKTFFTAFQLRNRQAKRIFSFIPEHLLFDQIRHGKWYRYQDLSRYSPVRYFWNRKCGIWGKKWKFWYSFFSEFIAASITRLPDQRHIQRLLPSSGLYQIIYGLGLFRSTRGNHP